MPQMFVLMVSSVWTLMVQLVPSKWRAVCVPALSTAAQTSPGPAALTLWMKVPSSSGERDQLVPSQCHMPSDTPTQTSFGPEPETLEPLTFGTVDHALPSQCCSVAKPAA